jgi:hypothetical protein
MYVICSIYCHAEWKYDSFDFVIFWAGISAN